MATSCKIGASIKGATTSTITVRKCNTCLLEYPFKLVQVHYILNLYWLFLCHLGAVEQSDI